MTKQQHSIDGFVPRRPSSQLGEQRVEKPTAPLSSPNRFYPTVSSPEELPSSALRRSETGPLRADISDSLKGIDDIDEKGPKKKKWGRGEPNSKRRRIIKWVTISLLVILLAVGAWVAYKALTASNHIFKGNIFDIIQSKPLKEDANGRSNILIFGTSEDDPGHDGAGLTDSIMVISLNQKKKNAYMISIPRDLYVKYGATCPEGYQGKINSLYSCYSEDETKEAEGANALKAKVGEILDLDIQYYAHLNYTAVRQAVDAVGGVDIKIESEDPRGILDRNFDWKCGYRCHYVNYKNGQIAHMDGEHALAFARARNASGGYGLPNGNFDREKNQQKVIKALREKAVSAGTLTNVGKVTGLIDALGNNLRTNFETKEIRTLISLGKDIKSEQLQPVSLVEEGNMLVTTGNIGGASIVKPLAGLYDYGQIQAYVNKKVNANEITQEGANVVVLNASGVGGLAQEEADSLAAKGFTISGVDNAPEGTYGDAEIYQIGDGKPATKAKLESIYKVKTKTSTPPVPVAEGTHFVVIIGKDRSAN